MKSSGEVVMLGMPRRFVMSSDLQAGGGTCTQCEDDQEVCPECDKRMGKMSQPLLMDLRYLNSPIVGNPTATNQSVLPKFIHPKFLNSPIIGNPNAGLEGTTLTTLGQPTSFTALQAALAARDIATQALRTQPLPIPTLARPTILVPSVPDLQEAQDNRIADALGIKFEKGDDAKKRQEKIQKKLKDLGYSSEMVEGLWRSGAQTILNHHLFGGLSDETVLALLLYGETTGQSEELARWTASSVKNRAEWKKESIKDTALSGKAYSAFNKGDSNLDKLLEIRKALFTKEEDLTAQQKALLKSPAWTRAISIASDTLAGRNIPAGSGTATHYYDTSLADPDWAYANPSKKTDPYAPDKKVPTFGGKYETRFYDGRGKPPMGTTIRKAEGEPGRAIPEPTKPPPIKPPPPPYPVPPGEGPRPLLPREYYEQVWPKRKLDEYKEWLERAPSRA